MKKLLLLFPPIASLAQVTVDGDVVRKSTGEPVPGVRVAARCGPFFTATDVAGHFRLTGLPAGTCPLSLIGPGWLSRDQTITSHPPDSHVTIRVPMTPEAVIAGKVVDENGWPIPRVVITAAQYRTVSGVRQLESAGRVQVNDLGEYRIAKLPPGRYYLRVRPLLSVPWSDYAPVWYPSAADLENAGAIDLIEGQRVDLDVHLSRGGGVEVSGHVTWPAGFHAADGNLELTYEELRGTPTVPNVSVAADGNFTIRHVAPGKYKLTATPRNLRDNATPPKYWAAQTIDVGRDNIGGIVLKVAETPIRDLKGLIALEGAARVDGLSIALQGQSNTLFKAKMEADGSFVIPGVWPGRYIGVANWSDTAEVTSLRFGEQEILQRSFDFDGTDAPLLVTARERRPFVRFSGTVTDSSGRTVIGAGLVFVPTGAGRRMTASTDQNGAFFLGLQPGSTYRVYVVEDAAEGEPAMGDPDFLKAQERKFPPVTVVAGENPPLKLVLPGR